MTQQISPRDYELLSAYLDGELSARDRARLEARMTKQPELRFGLEELRQTSILLRNLPRKRAPRNFTIPNALPRRRALPRLYPALRFASALAGILFLIVFIGDYALGTSTQNLASKIAASTSVPASANESQAPRDLATTAAAPVVPVPDNPPAPFVPSPIPTETATPQMKVGAANPQSETPVVESGSTQSTEEPIQGPSMFTFSVTEEGPAGMGGGAGEAGSPCDASCTPQPTETVAPTSEADTSDATEGGVPPTIGSSAAGSMPAATTPTPTLSVENTPVPEFSREASTRIQQGATDETETAPGERVRLPTDTPAAEAASQQPLVKAPDTTNSTMSTPESPTLDASALSTTANETPAIAPTAQLTLREKLSQPNAQMIVRLAEIGLAGFAFLAGLAAILLRINSRP